ncbi:hypothetical protein WN51_10791 [Melipona quadrifasciata]|uniref:Uncharacterized protein n=1 Tax=Melipona quadrifasciata TaxID=166423 RepID=A0A0M9A4A3_9HYME|nr:hypothetical protein WN51_10791 [Melipona quadrifasciata]
MMERKERGSVHRSACGGISELGYLNWEELWGRGRTSAGFLEPPRTLVTLATESPPMSSRSDSTNPQKAQPSVTKDINNNIMHGKRKRKAPSSDHVAYSTEDPLHEIFAIAIRMFRVAQNQPPPPPPPPPPPSPYNRVDAYVARRREEGRKGDGACAPGEIRRKIEGTIESKVPTSLIAVESKLVHLRCLDEKAGKWNNQTMNEEAVDRYRRMHCERGRAEGGLAGDLSNANYPSISGGGGGGGGSGGGGGDGGMHWRACAGAAQRNSSKRSGVALVSADTPAVNEMVHFSNYAMNLRS